MDLERELRDVLSDDRLSLPIRPNAVALVEAGVRRRRRNRAIATASAAAVLIAGGVTATSFATRGGGGGPQRIFGPDASASPTAAGKPSPPTPTRDEVPWADTAYDYRNPPPFPGAIADLSVPWCRADQLTLSKSFVGVTGNLLGDVTVTSASASTCALQGQPVVRIESADGAALVASTPEPFYVDAWLKLQSGATASARVLWLQQYCGHPAPARLVIALPHGGGELSTSFTDRPACDSVVPTTSHLVVDGFVNPRNEVFTPEVGLQPSVDTADASVAPGATLHYRLQLQSLNQPSVFLNPCLPYRERLVDHATQHVLIEEDHLLNCGEAPSLITDAQSNHDTFFDLQLVVPMNAPAGDYDLLWQSVLKPVAAATDQLVHVTPPVPACRDGQLSATAGRQGAGLGSYYDDIVFRNVSAATCSLFGYPGVKLADANGRPVKTDLQRGPATPHLVVLAPGQAASTTISGADSGPNGGATPCRPSAGVLVIAPGQRLQTLLRRVGMRCYDTVTTWPVVAGTRGSVGG